MFHFTGTSVDIALDRILYKIDNYELASGDIVSDLEISKELDISRTPIREAIRILLDNGLLEKKGSKVIVKPITLVDISEILEVREAIEKMSIDIIINKNKGLLKEQLDTLKEIHNKLYNDISSGDFTSNFKYDELFHSKLIEFSNNSRLITISQRISLQGQRLRWITLLTPNRFLETIDEHSIIISGIENLDFKTTIEAISSHLGNSRENYFKILNNSQWNKIAMQMQNMTL